MTVEQIPTTPQMGRSLIEHDPASKAYPARALVGTAVERKNKTWRRVAPYDQGATSSCVGQTMSGILNSGPWSGRIPLTTRRKFPPLTIYKGAQENDEWPGEEPDYQGSSALGACKYLAANGVIKEYRWCFSVDDVIDTLVAHGPVGIGVWWYQGMMDVDGDGFIKPEGSEVGGHEVELNGVHITGEYVIGTNSWGPGWGQRGRFKLRWDDLAKLLGNKGDAVTLVTV